MSDLGPHDLVFNTTNILGGGVREIVAAAVAGEYQGITIWPSDVARAESEGMSLRDVKTFVHDHGLVVTDVDCLLGWTEQALPKPGEAMVEIVGTDRFLEIAEALDADAINVAQGFGSELDLDRAAEDLAAIARRAGEQGRNVNFEFLPWCGVANPVTNPSAPRPSRPRKERPRRKANPVDRPKRVRISRMCCVTPSSVRASSTRMNGLSNT